MQIKHGGKPSTGNSAIRSTVTASHASMHDKYAPLPPPRPLSPLPRPLKPGPARLISAPLLRCCSASFLRCSSICEIATAVTRQPASSAGSAAPNPLISTSLTFCRFSFLDSTLANGSASIKPRTMSRTGRHACCIEEDPKLICPAAAQAPSTAACNAKIYCIVCA